MWFLLPLSNFSFPVSSCDVLKRSVLILNLVGEDRMKIIRTGLQSEISDWLRDSGGSKAVRVHLLQVLQTLISEVHLADLVCSFLDACILSCAMGQRKCVLEDILVL